ncbi:hypothetical protein T265_06098 [Opisthorchis viverrini]|uniref:Uncharacterized protein n=1 Tax=Opisthorchis viverrini TaxID=6198 RepID=A0A074ZLV7_OPIVI|nr:hypothetical protein T265_06098 [Opisthorchis viverrini]KER26737.1 hypothetical protein T265_06098 [Opisthorchis viverrini]
MQFASRPGSCKSLCASSRESRVAKKALKIAQLHEYRVKPEVELQRAHSKTELVKIELEAEENSRDEVWEPVASNERVTRYAEDQEMETFQYVVRVEVTVMTCKDRILIYRWFMLLELYLKEEKDESAS